MPWWASPRDHRDHRDDGGQDADGEGAEQHLQNLYCGNSDGVLGYVSIDVRFD